MAKVLLASALFAALCVGCAAPVTDDAAQNIDPAADEASIGAAAAAEEQSDSSREQQLQVIVSPGKAGGFSCEPLKAACRNVAATRPLEPPSGWLLWLQSKLF